MIFMRDMKIRIVASIVAVASCAVVFGARADDSLGDQEYWDKEMYYAQRSLDATNAKCGTKITFEFAGKPDFRRKATAAGVTPNGVCTAILDELTTLCGTPAKATRVQQKIKSVSCSYAQPRTFSLASGKLTLGNNNNEANFGDWAKVQLGRAL